MAARYVRIGQYPDYRDELRGKLSEILASTANPGTYAAPEDVAGCTLEMGSDGLWTGASMGTLTQVQADALVASGAMANVKAIQKISRYAKKVGCLLQTENPCLDGITLTLASDATGYPNGIPNDNPSFVCFLDKTTGYSGGQNKVPVSLSVAENLPMRFCFSIYGDFQIRVWGDGDNLKLWVDGDRVYNTITLTKNTSVRINCTFSTLRRRRVVLQCMQLVGILTALKDTIIADDMGQNGNLLVIGDSWVSGGSPDSFGCDIWTHLLARRMGVENYYCAGISGTGYSKTNGVGMGYGNQARMVGNLGYVPDGCLILVEGSINDIGEPEDLIKSGADSLYTYLRRNFPTSQIVCIGPQYTSMYPGAGTVEGIVFSKATQYNIPTISTRGWFTGSGKTTSIANNGNQDYYIGGIGHLTPSGHAMYAQRVHAALTDLGIDC